MSPVKPVKIRVRPGIRGLDAVVIDDKGTTVSSRSWSEVSTTLANDLLTWQHKGQPMFETEEDASDNEAAEGSASSGKAADTGG